MKRIEKNGVVYFAFKNIEATGIVRHGFSTRIGGVSRGDFASMNLGLYTDDNMDDVEENRRRFCRAVGFGDNPVAELKQHHTTDIIRVDENLPLNVNGDGLITNMPGIVLTTYYADCVPLLLCDPVKGVIANCHAGWRGTVRNMAGIAVQKMVTEYGCNPRDIIAGIGPSISQKNFEVGPEVAQEFNNLLPFSEDFVYNSDNKPNKFYIDLWGINRHSFIKAGIPEENIETARMCTFDDETHFYSHRRNGKARGSLAAFIALEE
jgi:YfiH family protein